MDKYLAKFTILQDNVREVLIDGVFLTYILLPNDIWLRNAVIIGAIPTHWNHHGNFHKK